MIFAVDPGPIESAYVILDSDLYPYVIGKVKNEDLIDTILNSNVRHFAYEMIASYGMAVGKDVFETCVWIGRFIETARHNDTIAYIQAIYRKDVTMNICQSVKAGDSNVRRALIDRFAEHDLKNGKGTKKNPDWFFGFKDDIWSAYAVGVTYHDLHLKGDSQ